MEENQVTVQIDVSNINSIPDTIVNPETGWSISREAFECSIIVRGKDPEASGVKGSYIFLIKEKKNSKEPELIYPAYIDGDMFREDVWYKIEGGKLCIKKS